MDVSVVICTRDRAASLSDTLRALCGVAIPQGDASEFILVDNGSRDHTQSTLEAHQPLLQSAGFEVRYIVESRPGLSRARNCGLRHAHGDVLIFTDDDVRPPAAWLRAVCEPLRAGTCEAVSGGVAMAPHLRRDWMTKFHRGWFASTEDLTSIPKAQRRLGLLIGANMAFHRSVLDKVPAFEEEIGAGALGFGEDVLFAMQLLEAGFRFGEAYDVLLEHHFEASRVARSQMLRRATLEGHTSAFLWHHWLHIDVTQLRARELANRLRLQLVRIRHRAELQPFQELGEGAPEWELKLLTKIACYRVLHSERRRERLYAKRGLLRLKEPINTP